MKTPTEHSLLNAKQLAEFLGCGVWLVRGVKKSNAHLAAHAGERLIFTGRYSTAAKVSKWLDDHPDFIARRVLVPAREPAESPSHSPGGSRGDPRGTLTPA